MTNNPKDKLTKLNLHSKVADSFTTCEEEVRKFIVEQITQARADERKKVGKELLGYFLGENNKKVELAIREITGEKL